MTPARIVLGSTSRYRAELLRRLGLDFEARAPGTVEHVVAGEPPADRALRLAIAKATDAGAGLADALVIGSDQVAELEGHVLDKPGSEQRAFEQLVACSGHVVNFHTALCLFDCRNGKHQTHVDLTRVHFRVLDAAEIKRYIDREQPLDCAGSFKCEGLGISLFERIDNSDPTALIGLPLIALTRLLRDTGVNIP
ncbi:septum formation protein Maf [Dyella dinghuensis]|uniref:7-methyl-GTP pyrophosphatase n=1 Tax=Dyella dinghuensis TaxID=1920169 RepID=A0A432LVW3_9GAMM|nr:Maf family nucleotide pyrophosphatase [Dyella dinghuensis]RUL66204.1 septum formation protein Maf [Dyella dinghuensis]